MQLADIASSVATAVAQTHPEPSLRDVVNAVVEVAEKHDLTEEHVVEVAIMALDVALPAIPGLPGFLSELIEDAAIEALVPALVHQAFRLLR